LALPGIYCPTNRLGLGDKIRLDPGHCDPTVNLHDCYVGVRANRASRQPIAASGQLFPRSRPLWRREQHQMTRQIVSRHL